MALRVIVLLGESRASLAAREYAFRVARDTGATLIGWAGVDLVSTETTMPGGIGSAAYQERLERGLIEQGREACARLYKAYEGECKHRTVPFDCVRFEGDFVNALSAAAERCDLLITGHDTAFAGNKYDRSSSIVTSLCRSGLRPLVVCAKSNASDGDIMVGYDGGASAARAVQLFALLELGIGRRVHVVSVGTTKESIEGVPERAGDYLRRRGFEVEVHAIATRTSPIEVLRAEVSRRKIDTLVVGVYGHTGLRARLFGSTTRHLLEDPPSALFVYH